MGSPVDLDCARSTDPVVFKYGDRDVEKSVNSTSGWTETHYSQFDRLLCSCWDEATRSGVFRYTLDEVVTRPLPGHYGFIIQRNPKRFSHRRKPADMHSLSQPFDPTSFNFNKINKREILLELIREDTDGLKSHWLLVNVSPIDYGHVLLVPEPQACLPQVMTQDSVQLCLDIVAMSSHRGFCMVANSLLAYASVNHLHYHFMYLAQPPMAGRVGGRPCTKCCYELENHPSHGFGFELNNTTADCAQNIFKVISLLIELNIPHNLVMLRGDPFNQHSPAPMVRTLLFPRKPAYGLKSMYECGQTPLFFAAACELGLGFIPVVDQYKYDTLVEDDVLQVINESVLSQAEFDNLRTKVKNLFCL